MIFRQLLLTTIAFLSFISISGMANPRHSIETKSRRELADEGHRNLKDGAEGGEAAEEERSFYDGIKSSVNDVTTFLRKMQAEEADAFLDRYRKKYTEQGIKPNWFVRKYHNGVLDGVEKRKEKGKPVKGD